MKTTPQHQLPAPRIRDFARGAYDSVDGLTPDTIAKLLDFIKGLDLPAGEAETLYQLIENSTNNSAGPMASDARRRGIESAQGREKFFQMFPDARRIKF